MQKQTPTEQFNNALFEVVVSSDAFSKYDDNVLMNKELERFFLPSLITTYPVKISCFQMLTLFEQKSNFKIGVMLDVPNILNIIDDYIFDLSDLILEKNVGAISFVKRVLLFRQEIFTLLEKVFYHYKYLDKAMVSKDRAIFAFANSLLGQKEKGSDQFRDPPLGDEHMNILYPPEKTNNNIFNDSTTSNKQRPKTRDEILEWANS